MRNKGWFLLTLIFWYLYNMNNACVYFHINPVKNEVFYVGIGINNRAYSKKNRSKIWHNTVKKYNYVVDITETNLTWEQACEREKFYIAKLGRYDLGKGRLVNMTDGGDGIKGYKFTEEQIKNLSKSHIGHKVKEETKKKLSIAYKGKSQSKELIKSRVESRKINGNYIVSQEQRDKISKTLTGRKGNVWTNEQKIKQSELLKLWHKKRKEL